ncbi:MAG: sensor histidine kinase N-terminal domain-containing protein [Sulfuricella denitrificans]|nr:sensor histidine kinase N-terminal domain-containing protein [Sulfuricella denitrificans]
MLGFLRLRYNSLRSKLLLWLLLPLLSLWLAGAVVAYFMAISFTNVAYDRALFDSTRSLAEQIVIAEGRATVELPRSAMQILLSDEYDKVFYQVTGRSGRVLSGEPELPRPPAGIRVGVPILHDGELHGMRLRIASLYMIPVGELQGRTVLVQVAETLNKRNILAREILTGMLAPQLALILVAALIVWYGVGRGLLPLQQVRREIASRSHRDLSPLPESNVPDEAQTLIHAINELMSSLGQALGAQQRFIADAAHQLRTPLAGLKAQTDLALRQTDPEQQRHALEQLSISTGRTVRLINQMLDLARVEPGADKTLTLKILDLDALAREIVMEWVPHTLRKEVDLGFEGGPDKLLIQGDALRLKMLLDNLIDNCLRYCPPGGSRVTVKVTGSAEGVVLAVEDNGPGIPVAERDKVFQRFYRVLGNEEEGSGLGLAIVQEVAHLHGARVEIVTPEAGSGTEVRVTFPFITGPHS